MVYITNSDRETAEVGKSLAEKLATRKIRRAVIAMRGEMGVGKTVFTRGFAEYFGIHGVKSPTYTIVNEHRSGGVRLFHFDLYRISDGDDLYSIGYDDYLGQDGYCIMEWSERVPEEIPDGAIYVTISRVPENDGQRKIDISDF